VGKPQAYPAVFNIDVSVCMSCQICVEVCPFDAIRMDTVFELSTDNRFGGLLWTKEQLAKSNEYYQTIHPTEAAETDERRAKEAADAKAKAAAAAAKAAQAAATPSSASAGETAAASANPGNGASANGAKQAPAAAPEKSEVKP
jgi:NADH-quinone oxidoreductase subunit I